MQLSNPLLACLLILSGSIDVLATQTLLVWIHRFCGDSAATMDYKYQLETKISQQSLHYDGDACFSIDNSLNPQGET